MDWENVNRTINSLPKMLQVWITKHASGFCGTNKHLSLLHTSQTTQCQCCGSPNETTQHITRCPNPGQLKMFNETVKTLIQWIDSKTSYPPLTHSIQTYLHFWGKNACQQSVRICQLSPFLHAIMIALVGITSSWGASAYPCSTPNRHTLDKCNLAYPSPHGHANSHNESWPYHINNGYTATQEFLSASWKGCLQKSTTSSEIK